MKYFKDEKGDIFAYELDGSQDHLIGNKKSLTKAEITKMENKNKSGAKISEARRYLVDTIDYLHRFIELGEEMPEEIAKKRKEAWKIIKS